MKRTWRTATARWLVGAGIDNSGIVLFCGDWGWHFRMHWRAL